MANLKDLIKQSPLYAPFHVIRRAGLRHYLRRLRLSGLIDPTRPAPTSPVVLRGDSIANTTPADVEVHLLVRAADVRMALWAIKSLFASAQTAWPVVFHSGGAMRPKDVACLHRHFPNARFLPRDEADRRMEPLLRGDRLERAAEARLRGPMLRKLLDPLVLSTARWLLVLDSDVLFFSEPKEVLEAVAGDSGPNWFNRDQVEGAYNLAGDRAETLTGLRPLKGLNAGLALVRRESMPLSRIDELLGIPEVLGNPFFAEQTVHALLASEVPTRLLPATYACTTRPGLATDQGERLVSKHYIETPRPLFFEEGIPELVRLGLTRR